jgi:hypothetical protein
MKNKIILSLIGFLMIAGGFDEGCEEEEPKSDYITVIVAVQGALYKKNLNTGERICDFLTWTVPMKVVITKAQGENFTLFPQTDECNYDSESVSFKLYREQPIEVDVSTQYVPGGYTLSEGYAKLEWEDVYPSNDFGETTSWVPTVIVHWLFVPN